MKRVGKGVCLALLCAVSLGAAPKVARSQSAFVLHERLGEVPDEDLALAGASSMPSLAGGGGGSALEAARRERGRDARSPHEDEMAFRPDLDTRRPDALPYEEPFEPSVAPFKRNSAFDRIDAGYTLVVQDARLYPMALQGPPLDAGREERFTGRFATDTRPDHPVRIDSVAPGARVLSARFVANGKAVRFRLLRDGAENWYLDTDHLGKGRLEVDVAAPREAFGLDFGNPSYASLPAVAPLPANVRLAAAEVTTHIGVSRSLSPRENMGRLVQYFRGFTDSEEPTTPRRDVYLDLALSQRGVCRHRAFAFMITAQSLGIPTRFVMNEAHAWVEVYNGALWKRIDLGGAGRGLVHSPQAAFDPPPDPFSWPQGASRGEDLVKPSLKQNGKNPDGTPASGENKAGSSPATQGSNGPSQTGPKALDRPGGPGGGGAGDKANANRIDRRAASTVTLDAAPMALARGVKIPVNGRVMSEGDACAHLSVLLVLREPKSGGKTTILGTLATDESGRFSGTVEVPRAVTVGDYDLVAATSGDGRCGEGVSP